MEAIYARPDPIEALNRLRQQQQHQDSTGSGPQLSGKAGKGVGSSSRSVGSIVTSAVDLEGTARATGRRKTSFAHVALVDGVGRVTVNGAPLDAYFSDVSIRAHVLRPLLLTRTLGRYDVEAEVKGGGFSGQAQAVAHGVARALVMQNGALSSRLRKLTRWDGRVVERKKPGRAKARKAYAWVKR